MIFEDNDFLFFHEVFYLSKRGSVLPQQFASLSQLKEGGKAFSEFTSVACIRQKNGTLLGDLDMGEIQSIKKGRFQKSFLFLLHSHIRHCFFRYVL